MKIDLSNRFSEVFAILKCLDESDRNKIPLNVWAEIKKRKNNLFEYSYIPGDEEYLDDFTIAILNEIYFKYLKAK